MKRVIAGRFQIKSKIGSGSFGTIFKGYDTKLKKDVAIKLEKQCEYPQLCNESRIYNRLSGGVNIPKHLYFGIESKQATMVMELCGKNLEQLLAEHGRFSLKTTLLLADQMLSAIEFVHKMGYIHRDIKPENFVLGLAAEQHKVMLIDFGLSTPYRNLETNKHIKFTENNSFVGTARYASAHSLRGIEQSRRDDLESIAYCLIYMLKGSLPWMNMNKEFRTLKAKQDEIGAMKLRISPETLCSDLPPEFVWFLSSVRRLKFTEDPKYAEYRSAFRRLFIKSGFSYDYVYDWSLVRPMTIRVRPVKVAIPTNENNKKHAVNELASPKLGNMQIQKRRIVLRRK